MAEPGGTAWALEFTKMSLVTGAQGVCMGGGEEEGLGEQPRAGALTGV